MTAADRSRTAWTAMQSAQDPMGPYARMYRARVVAQSEDTDLVDVRPEDPRLPDMAKIPLRHGIPGLRVQVALGSWLLVGWDNGRPDKPFAALWAQNTHVLKISVVGDRVNLGGRMAFNAAVEGTAYRTAEDSLLLALQAAAAALQAASTVGPLAALQPGFTAMQTALATFNSAASANQGFLSTKVFLE